MPAAPVRQPSVSGAPVPLWAVALPQRPRARSSSLFRAARGRGVALRGAVEHWHPFRPLPL
eukprot:138544-Alexandrium_andersonii.AAC.1